MAGKVMAAAIQNLYVSHLKPSYISLQSASILNALDQKEHAIALCESLFNFHYDHYQSSLKSNGHPDREDAYLLQQSAQLLNQLGVKKYIAMLNNLGM